MCNLKITSPLCILPTGAGLLKSLSLKRGRVKVLERPDKKEDRKETQKEGGIKMENGARVGGQ